MKMTLIGGLLSALVLAIAGLSTVAQAGGKCPQYKEECNRTAPKKNFKGDKQIPDQIRVTVCHKYWDRLDVGTLNGRRTKWWGPSIQFSGWSADLPATAQRCKTFYVKPGSRITTYASCVDRVIRTPAMKKAGTYSMS